MPAPVLLFVYGTLRRGEPAHALLGPARPLGPARTAPRFELVDFGAYPGLVPGGSTAVVGELYEVDAGRFPELDDYEGCHDLYERVPIELDGGATAQAYVHAPAHAAGQPRIACGDWAQRGRP